MRIALSAMKTVYNKVYEKCLLDGASILPAHQLEKWSSTTYHPYPYFNPNYYCKKLKDKIIFNL